MRVVPELAEVEFLRRELEATLLGRRLLSVWADSRAKFTGATDLQVGFDVEQVRRRGKFLILEFTSQQDLIVHLGMTGGFTWDTPPPNHVRVRMTFSNGTLFLNDPRGFGRAVCGPRGTSAASPTLERLGLDPLDPLLDLAQARDLLLGLRGSVKGRLLSQRAVAGVGNYMADEICWRALIAPGAESIGPVTAELVVAQTVEVAHESLALGGVSQRDYVHLDGSAGRYQEMLRCYGRAGLPCLRCATPLSRGRVAGRSSTWCPACQAARGV